MSQYREPVTAPERVRGRYAPSPTGDLHLGNLRTAVLAWLFAHHGDHRGDHRDVGPGELLYRIEDLDPSRVRPGTADRQRADLESLGLVFDPPLVIQSTRFEAYASALDSLREQTFECFCSRREIAESASAPHGTPRRYPGTCRNLSAAERAERRRSRPPAIRLRAEPEPVTVVDLMHGEITGRPDDIVLQRNDGSPAYNLAVVVDDAGSGINQVVRGDDLLDSAISHAYLARLLGQQPPTYAHVPLALNTAGQRLAKRDGAVTLADLAPYGIGAPQVLSLIAVSLGLATADEQVDLATLRDRFDPARLPRTPWVVTAPGRD
ncbi:glutamyl-Q tRNA(Asp) synthetase [Microlunatus endophyticus]|uniref:Glutamyl-Q tRNA(Asp) synthetase n=1 Tax=Microlunatus endophyticus TaxID=1716077 RepID=A0A917S113_9ACTN|nr:glutamyl-Q tRNA(Asp) synthetase [Microlunatus endophyticus]